MPQGARGHLAQSETSENALVMTLSFSRIPLLVEASAYLVVLSPRKTLSALPAKFLPLLSPPLSKSSNCACTMLLAGQAQSGTAPSQAHGHPAVQPEEVQLVTRVTYK